MSVRFDTNTSDCLFSTTNLASPVLRTVCFWGKFISVGAGSVRSMDFLTDSGPTHGFRFDWGNADHLVLTQVGGTSIAFPSDPTIVNCNFYCATARAAGANSLNGYFRDNAAGSLITISTTGIASFTPTQMAVGQVATGGAAIEMFNYIEYDAELTSAQALAQSRQVAPLSGITLRRYVAMNNAATAGTDTSGNGFHLTVSGSLTDGASSPVFNPINPSRRTQRVYETVYSFE